MLPIRPAAAHRVTVFGSTRKITATSPGVRRRPPLSLLDPFMPLPPCVNGSLIGGSVYDRSLREIPFCDSGGSSAPPGPVRRPRRRPRQPARSPLRHLVRLVRVAATPGADPLIGAGVTDHRPVPAASAETHHPDLILTEPFQLQLPVAWHRLLHHAVTQRPARQRRVRHLLGARVDPLPRHR